jgi:maltose/moltooligosaccharide transporter
MGVFNFFVVIPQIVSGIVLGFFSKHVFNGHAASTLVLGGISMALAGALTVFVKDSAKPAG